MKQNKGIMENMHDLQPFADSVRTIVGYELSQEQLRALKIYEDELLAWNQNISLTAIRDPEGVRTKHFLDSLTILRAWDRQAPPERIIDVGTGAGFPGLVLKLVWPKAQLTLVESVHKKADFCRHMAERLNLEGVIILPERAEDVGQDPAHRHSYDLAVARAVARMPILMEYLLPLVQVFVLDLETNALNTVLDVGLSDTDFSQPRWSPDGESVAVSLRPVNASISKALWVLRLDGLVNRQITDDPTATFTAYEWDPWGDRLVYQRYDLGSSKTSIWLWQSGENKMIIDNGTRPKWLPQGR